MKQKHFLLLTIGLFMASSVFPHLSFAKKDPELEKIKKVLEYKVHIKAENGEVFNAGQEAAMDPKTGRVYVLTNLVGVKQNREGGGIILDPKGFIAANFHTVSNAARITVTLHDHTELEATIAQSYSDRDIAILRVKPPKPLKAIPFADSDSVKVGDQMYVIANSKQISNKIGGAQVTGLDQTKNENEKTKAITNIIQFVTDLPLQEGDSGSPILTKTGEFLGFIEAGHALTQNPIYALPSNVIHNYYLKFLKTGKKN